MAEKDVIKGWSTYRFEDGQTGTIGSNRSHNLRSLKLIRLDRPRENRVHGHSVPLQLLRTLARRCRGELTCAVIHLVPECWCRRGMMDCE